MRIALYSLLLAGAFLAATVGPALVKAWPGIMAARALAR